MEAKHLDDLLATRFQKRFDVDTNLENRLMDLPFQLKKHRQTIYWAAASVVIVLSLNIFALLQSEKNQHIEQVSSYFSNDITTYYEEQ